MACFLPGGGGGGESDDGSGGGGGSSGGGGGGCKSRTLMILEISMSHWLHTLDVLVLVIMEGCCCQHGCNCVSWVLYIMVFDQGVMLLWW